MAEQVSNQGSSDDLELGPQHSCNVTSEEVIKDQSAGPADTQMDAIERSLSPSSNSSDSLSELGFDTMEWPLPNPRCVCGFICVVTSGLVLYVTSYLLYFFCMSSIFLETDSRREGFCNIAYVKFYIWNFTFKTKS